MNVLDSIVIYLLFRKYYRCHKDNLLPFFPIQDNRLSAMLKLAQVKPGEKMLDLGSGDGKILIAFARMGAYCCGVEIDKTLCSLSGYNIWRRKLSGKVFIRNGNFWNISFEKYDIITVYGMNCIMDRLERKILKEAKIGCRILSNRFTFPGMKPVRVQDFVYLYIKS